MSKCWAECLGDCAGKMSREHTISEGVHFSDQIIVQGLSWCPDKPVSIGLSSLTRKILCKHHNEGLSFADGAAVSAIRSFEDAIKLHTFRSSRKPASWSRTNFTIDGHGLESWFLKTLINITYESDKLIGKTALPPGIPPKELVEIAFGRRQFAPPAGLYTIPSVGENAVLDGRIHVTIVSQEPPTTSGALFIFGGLRYFLYLDDAFTPGPENFRNHNDPIVSQTSFMYRFRKVQFPVHGKRSVSVTINW
jgi:hypothetical protein